jgi:NDP-sugar pyrophosphorylase family protein
MPSFIAHRINTISELKSIPNHFGIEVDLRDNIDGTIYLAHDPFVPGELFEDFLKHYNHNFIILNIKSEAIEYKILDLLKIYNIIDYFFLDSSFPMITKLIKLGESKIAVRYSEYESFESVMNLAGKVDWVWIDCFTKIPLNYYQYLQLKRAGFKLCFVSPELQGQSEKIEVYNQFFTDNNIVLDMICTKIYNIHKWQNIQIVIPMSGIGKRFIKDGYTDPKPLIQVDGKPIIEHVVNLFPFSSNFLFICNNFHLETTNMISILNKISPNCTIFPVSIDNRRGPVDAVLQASCKIDDNKEVIVSYCDYGTEWNYLKFLKEVRDMNCDGAIACYRGFHPHMLGKDNYAFLRETVVGSKLMAEIKEKEPFTNDRMNEYASNGTYYFRNGKILKKYFQKLMDLKIELNGEYYVSLVYNLMVQDELRIYIHEIDKMLQWGTPYDLQCYQYWSKYFQNIINPIPKFIDRIRTTLILPLAGRGSRFQTEGFELPKPLIKVNGLPMIIQAVNSIPQCQKQVFICLEEHCQEYKLKDTIENYYPNSKVIMINKVTDGQACTCEIGLKMTDVDMDSPILISACDNGVSYNVEEYQRLVDDESNDVIVWSFRNNPTSQNNPNMYAWLKVDSENNIKHVSCKKFIYENPMKTHAIIGTMFFRKARYFQEGLEANYKENIRTNGEYYVDDVLNQNIKTGLKVVVFEVDHYICWGTPNDYRTYNYWQSFFDKCQWHNYSIEKDITFTPLKI